jgi:hypothetical protein
MRKKIIFLIFTSVLTFSALAQICKPNIIGAWRCVSSVHGGVRKKVKDVIFIKYITKTSFTWVSSSKETKIVRSAMGGTCSYDGKIYVENIAYIGPDMTRFLNKKHIFNVDITGNKMHLYGTMSDKVYIDENWVRVDRE